MSVCLRAERYAEQIERLALDFCWRGKQDAGVVAPKADEIACQRGEIGEQSAQAVRRHRLAVRRVGAFAGGFAARCRRRLGLCHRRGALRIACDRVVLVEQARLAPGLPRQSFSTSLSLNQKYAMIRAVRDGAIHARWWAPRRGAQLPG